MCVKTHRKRKIGVVIMPPEKEQAVLVQQTTQKKESNKKKQRIRKISCFMIQRNSYKVIEDWNYP